MVFCDPFKWLLVTSNDRGWKGHGLNHLESISYFQTSICFIVLLHSWFSGGGHTSRYNSLLGLDNPKTRTLPIRIIFIIHSENHSFRPKMKFSPPKKRHTTRSETLNTTQAPLPQNIFFCSKIRLHLTAIFTLEGTCDVLHLEGTENKAFLKWWGNLPNKTMGTTH